MLDPSQITVDDINYATKLIIWVSAVWIGGGLLGWWINKRFIE